MIDENLFQLVEAAKALKMHVICPLPGESDQDIAERLCGGRILITNNSKDFLHLAPGNSIGLISLEGLKFIDSNPTVRNQTMKLIARVMIKYNLRSKRDGFFLELRENGKHRLHEF